MGLKYEPASLVRAASEAGVVLTRPVEACGRAPLVLAPHRIMCMGVESFTEENRGSATCGPYRLDVHCVKSLRSSHMG